MVQGWGVRSAGNCIIYCTELTVRNQMEGTKYDTKIFTIKVKIRGKDVLSTEAVKVSKTQDDRLSTCMYERLSTGTRVQIQ